MFNIYFHRKRASYLFGVVLLIGVLCTQFSQGNSKRIKFAHLGMEQGLSESIVLSILQDSRGYMWFGTAEGLNRFDGYNFTVFKHSAQDSGTIRHNYVQVLYEDTSQLLWVGTMGGLDWYNPRTERFHHIALAGYKNGVLINEYPVHTIIEDPSGKLWIGTGGGGMYCLTVQRPSLDSVAVESIKHYTDDPNNPNDVNGTFLFPICIDSTGKLWVSSLEKGMSILDPTTDSITHILHDPRNPASLNSNRTRTALFDNTNTLWIGTEDKGLNKHIPGTGTYIHYTAGNTPGSLTNNVIRSVYEDSNERLWVATDGGGLLLYHPATDTFEAFRHDAANPASIANDRVISMYEDRSGTLWFGTWGSGVDRWSPVKNKFANNESLEAIETALPIPFVISFFESRDGSLWVGTHGGGAVTYRPQTATIERLAYNPQNPYGLPNGAIWSIREDDAGDMWFATDMGVCRYNRNAGKFSYYTDKKSPLGQLGSHYTGKAEPIENAVWVTTERGLDKIDIPTGKITNFPYTLASIDSAQGYIAGLYYNNGILWIGTTPITAFDTKTERYISSPFASRKLIVSCITGDSKGRMWVGTFGDGVYLFDSQFELLEHFTEQSGLPNNVVYGVLEDGRGNFWLSTNRGIARLNLTEHSFQHYDTDDGLQGNEFNRCAFYKMHNGMLLFGGVNGFNGFFPETIKGNPYIPPVVLTGFRMFNEQVQFSSPLPFLNQVTLKHSENFFSFEFAALSYTDPHKNTYAYMLEGFDKDWVNCDTRRFASYTNVTPGKYIFRVKASNNDGVWNEAGTFIHVIISPPWWNTWWAYILYGVLAISASAGIRWLILNWKIIIASKKAQYISHYRLYESLGEGGMGKVYRAADTATKQVVALKVLNPALLSDEENRKRLLNEGRLLASFSHPNIVKVIEVSESEQTAYIAMEYLPGGTLKQLLTEKKSLPLESALVIARQVCDGLNQIHSRGIIHRDIKSANVMFDEHSTVRIMDFGLSKSPLVTTMTTLGSVIGTLGYVAPEQVTGLHVDTRTDIFSFGVLLYEMLTGKLPFTGENEIAVIHSIFNTTPALPSTINPAIPTSMDAIIAKCLEKNASHRFPSITDVKIELDKVFS